MLNDTSLAVRLRALSILSSHEPDAEIQEAFMAVLRGEEAVQMRMLAMDHLAASEVGFERLDRVLEDLGRQEDRAVLVRAAGYAPPGGSQ